MTRRMNAVFMSSKFPAVEITKVVGAQCGDSHAPLPRISTTTRLESVEALFDDGLGAIQESHPVVPPFSGSSSTWLNGGNATDPSRRKRCNFSRFAFQSKKKPKPAHPTLPTERRESVRPVAVIEAETSPRNSSNPEPWEPPPYPSPFPSGKVSFYDDSEDEVFPMDPPPSSIRAVVGASPTMPGPMYPVVRYLLGSIPS
jgi:hypothetical protein